MTSEDARVASIAENRAAFCSANERLRLVSSVPRRRWTAVRMRRFALPRPRHAGSYPFMQTCASTEPVCDRVRPQATRNRTASRETDDYQLIEKTGTAGEIARARWLMNARR